MWWIIDLILVALILFVVIRNAVKGLMYSIYNVAKFVLAVLAAVMLGKPIGAWISTSFIAPELSDYVFEKVTSLVGGAGNLSEFFNNIPEGFVKLLQLFGVDLQVIIDRFGNAENTEAVLREMSDAISVSLANSISAIIAYILVFVVAFLLLMLVFYLLRKIKLPFFTKIDKILGLLFGIVLGFLSASMLATAIYSVIEFVAAVNSNSEVCNLYNDSYVFKFIYNLKIFDFLRQLL